MVQVISIYTLGYLYQVYKKNIKRFQPSNGHLLKFLTALCEGNTVEEQPKVRPQQPAAPAAMVSICVNDPSNPAVLNTDFGCQRPLATKIFIENSRIGYLLIYIYSGMFVVEPRGDCPHLAEFSKISSTPLQQILDIKSKSILFGANLSVPSPCKLCNDSSENWLCLSCFQIGCSRYVNSHQQKHYDETGHCIATSFSDLSVWCYQCDSYIKHPVCVVVVLY